MKNLKNTLQLLEFIKVARGGHSAARIIKNQRMSESSKVDVCKALDIVIRSLTPCFRVQFIVFKWDTLRGNCLLPRTLAVFLQNGSHCVDFDHDIDHRCLQQYFLVLCSLLHVATLVQFSYLMDLRVLDLVSRSTRPSVSKPWLALRTVLSDISDFNNAHVTLKTL